MVTKHIIVVNAHITPRYRLVNSTTLLSPSVYCLHVISMPAVYFLIKMITRLSALGPVLSPWESCALHLIQKYRPSSVFFSCNTYQLCTKNHLLKTLEIPSQTVFGLEINELPTLKETDMVFWVDNKLITWDNETIEKYRLKGGTDFKIVVVANMSANIEDDLRSMKDLFSAMWLSGIVKCAVLLVNDTTSRIYTYLPFKDSDSCEDTSPVLLGECTKGIDQVFDLTYKIINLNQCPIRMAIVDDRPFIQFPMRGRLSYLVNEIALKMNASIVPITPLSGERGGDCGREEYRGSRGLVHNGTVHMTVGSFNQHECSTLEQVNVAYTQCMSWCTPVLSANGYIVTYLVQLFHPYMWLALSSSVFLVSVCVLVLNAVSARRWKSSDSLNLAIVCFAQSPSLQPRTSPVRLIVAIWMLACLVVRAAYEGELKSRSAVQLGSYIIYDLDELGSYEDIQLCASQSSLKSLKSLNMPAARKVFSKTKPCNGSLYNNIVAAAKLKDRAVFTGDLRCIVTASEIQPPGLHLYSKTGGCSKTIPMTTILALRGSPFIHRLRNIQDRCMQSGLILKWLNIQPPRKDLERVQTFAMNHFLPVLFVFGVGCFVSLLVLFCEIIWALITSA